MRRYIRNNILKDREREKKFLHTLSLPHTESDTNTPFQSFPLSHKRTRYWRVYLRSRQMILNIVMGVVYPLLLVEEALKEACKRRKANVVLHRSVFGPDKKIQRVFSIAPGGFNMAYTGGILEVLQEHPTYFDNAVFTGNSTGALVASCACAGIPPGTLASLMSKFNSDFSKRGCFGYHKLIPSLEELLYAALPEDAYVKCNNRLIILISGIEMSCPSLVIWMAEIVLALLVFVVMYYWECVGLAVCIGICMFFLILRGMVKVHCCGVGRFSSNDHLIQCILTSCSIPLVQDGFFVRKAPRGLFLVEEESMKNTHSKKFLSFGVDGSFTTRNGLLATEPGDGPENITIDWLKSRVPVPSVRPSVTLPSRVVVAPSNEEMYCLLDSGAKDVLSRLVQSE